MGTIFALKKNEKIKEGGKEDGSKYGNNKLCF